MNLDDRYGRISEQKDEGDKRKLNLLTANISFMTGVTKNGSDDVTGWRKMSPPLRKERKNEVKFTNSEECLF